MALTTLNSFHFLTIAAIADLVFHAIEFFVYGIINIFCQYSRLSRSLGLFSILSAVSGSFHMW